GRRVAPARGAADSGDGDRRHPRRSRRRQSRPGARDERRCIRRAARSRRPRVYALCAGGRSDLPPAPGPARRGSPPRAVGGMARRSAAPRDANRYRIHRGDVLMSALNLEPNLSRPDDFYEALIALHRDLTLEQSAKVNAKLILILANHIGDMQVLREAL